MPTKPLDRLMFVQGGLCFFCKKPLVKSEASVEHLLASSNGGSNNDENCVACCKAVNALLGSMSLKEKFQVTLNQKGQFVCPNGSGLTKTTKLKSSPKAETIEKSIDEKFKQILSNLKQRGNSRPRTTKSLMSTINSLFSNELTEIELNKMVSRLLTTGQITITGNKVVYSLE